MKICLLNETKSFLFHFFPKLITFHFPLAGKNRAYLPLYAFEKTRVSCCKLCDKNKSIKLQTLREEQKYQVTNVGVERIKLSRLPDQRINEFKITKFNTKLKKNTTVKFKTVLTNSNCKLFLGLELTSYIQAAYDSKRTGSPA